MRRLLKDEPPFTLLKFCSLQQESPAILKIVIKRQDPVSWNIVIIINHPLQLIDPIIALVSFFLIKLNGSTFLR